MSTKYHKGQIIFAKYDRVFTVIETKSSDRKERPCRQCVFSCLHHPEYDNSHYCGARRKKYLGTADKCYHTTDCSSILLPSYCCFKDITRWVKRDVDEKTFNIVKLLKKGAITNETAKYRLEIKTVESVHDCFVELKLYYGNNFALRIKEGNLRGKTYRCSSKEHELLKELGIATIFSEEEVFQRG